MCVGKRKLHTYSSNFNSSFSVIAIQVQKFSMGIEVLSNVIKQHDLINTCRILYSVNRIEIIFQENKAYLISGLGRGSSENRVNNICICTWMHFGHLVQLTDLLEKTLMPGEIEGKRRRGWQSMRWLDSITDSMDMSLSKL